MGKLCRCALTLVAALAALSGVPRASAASSYLVTGSFVVPTAGGVHVYGVSVNTLNPGGVVTKIAIAPPDEAGEMASAQLTCAVADPQAGVLWVRFAYPSFIEYPARWAFYSNGAIGFDDGTVDARAPCGYHEGSRAIASAGQLVFSPGLG